MTFTDSVLNLSDANGQISWTFAHALADFLVEYANFSKGERVDAGELLVWLGY
jgi:hypothetical protein